jgi:hypothetical protein
MTIALPLQPQEEAKLIALPKARAFPPKRSCVRLSITSWLRRPAEPRRIWDVILDNMSDVPPNEFAQLPKDGASEHPLRR